MKVLLDTHSFLWFVLNDPKLSQDARHTIQEPENEVLISPASFWEIAIKVRLGKIDLHGSYDDFVRRGIAGNDFTILPIEPRHTSVLTTLPLHHRDPFDRLLVAQAMIEDVAIVSVDTALDSYSVRRIW